MLATVHAATLHGIDGRVIRVEVDVAPGLPGFTIVGLPDAALQEARERVRGAIRNSGLAFPPRRITVNLAPADLRKAGASLDLAIAVGILLGSEQVRATGRWAFIGELSLGGELRAVPGILAMVGALARRGTGRIVVPEEAVREARLAGVEALPADRLGAVVHLLQQAASRRARRTIEPPARIELTAPAGSDGTVSLARSDPPGTPTAGDRAPVARRVMAPRVPDLADVRGQALGRRALEIALAGGHGLLLTGPPGSGKTLLARTIPGLQPPLTDAEAMIATTIASAAGEGPLTELIRDRPFRAPHHTLYGELHECARAPRGKVDPGPGRSVPAPATRAPIRAPASSRRDGRHRPRPSSRRATRAKADRASRIPRQGRRLARPRRARRRGCRGPSRDVGRP